MIVGGSVVWVLQGDGTFLGYAGTFVMISNERHCRERQSYHAWLSTVVIFKDAVVVRCRGSYLPIQVNSLSFIALWLELPPKIPNAMDDRR